MPPLDRPKFGGMSQKQFDYTQKEAGHGRTAAILPKQAQVSLQDGSGASFGNAETSSTSAYQAFKPEDYKQSRLPLSPPKHLIHNDPNRAFDAQTTSSTVYTDKQFEYTSAVRRLCVCVLSQVASRTSSDMCARDCSLPVFSWAAVADCYCCNR